jgi:hypothetical protein
MASNPFRKRLVKIDFKGTLDRSARAVSRGFRDTAVEMTTDIKEVLNVQGTKKVRSNPGEPPRRQSGKLHDNTQVIATGKRMIVRTLQYGIWLDGGTSRMDARPFIHATISNKRRFWTRRINANIRKHVKKK